MIFITGERQSKRPMGYVAGYCFVCRAARMLNVQTVGTRRHFYYVPSGKLKAQYLETRCDQCGTLYAKQLGSWLTYEQSEELSFESMSKTCPDLIEWLEVRNEIETRLAEGSASYSERMGILWESIATLEYMASIETTTGNYESITSVIAFMFIVCAVGASLVYLGNMRHPYDFLWIVGGVVSLLVLLWRIWSSSRSHKFRAVLENIANSMMPYSPTLQEIEQLKADHPDSGLFRSLKPDQLMDCINECLMDESKRLVSEAHLH